MDAPIFFTTQIPLPYEAQVECRESCLTATRFHNQDYYPPAIQSPISHLIDCWGVIAQEFTNKKTPCAINWKWATLPSTKQHSSVDNSLPIGVLSGYEDYCIWGSEQTTTCIRLANLPLMDSIRITETRSRDGNLYLEDLAPGAHMIGEVVKAVEINCDNLLSQHPTEIQKIGLKQLKGMQGYAAVAGQPSLAGMFGALDNILTGGKLKDWCTIRLWSPEEMEISQGQALLGCCESHHYSEVHPNFDFSIDPIPKATIIISSMPTLSNVKQVVHMYETLVVHELTHAILDVYSCGCDIGGPESCHEKYVKGSGCSGHGPAFQACAKVFNQTCRQECLIPCTSAAYGWDRELCLFDDLMSADPEGLLESDHIRNWNEEASNLIEMSAAEIDANEIDLHALAYYFDEAKAFSDMPSDFNLVAYLRANIPALPVSGEHPLLSGDNTLRYSDGKIYFYKQLKNWMAKGNAGRFSTDRPYGEKRGGFESAAASPSILDSETSKSQCLVTCLVPQVLPLIRTRQFESEEFYGFDHLDSARNLISHFISSLLLTSHSQVFLTLILVAHSCSLPFKASEYSESEQYDDCERSRALKAPFDDPQSYSVDPEPPTCLISKDPVTSSQRCYTSPRYSSLRSYIRAFNKHVKGLSLVPHRFIALSIFHESSTAIYQLPHSLRIHREEAKERTLISAAGSFCFPAGISIRSSGSRRSAYPSPRLSRVTPIEP